MIRYVDETGTLLPLLGLLLVAPLRAGERPNILFIMVDDLGNARSGMGGRITGTCPVGGRGRTSIPRSTRPNNLIDTENPEHRAALKRLQAVVASFPDKDAAPAYELNPPQTWDRKK